MVALNHVYQSQDNYQTSIQVEHALIRSYPDRFLGVSASAFYGIVELTGSVKSAHDKALAIQLAERVPGVTTVVESLRLNHVNISTGESAERPRRSSYQPAAEHAARLARLRWKND